MCSMMTLKTVLGPPWVSFWPDRAEAACNAACAEAFWNKNIKVFRIISTHFTLTANRSICQYNILVILFVISGSSRDVDEICVLLQYYAAQWGNSVARSSLPLKMGSTDCPETSLRDFHSTLRNIPKVRRSHPDFTGNRKIWQSHAMTSMCTV